MSRIGKKPVIIPNGVTIDQKGNSVKVKGPKGELEGTFDSKIAIEIKDSELIVTRPNDTKEIKALHGLSRALIQNMVQGVTEAFQKTLDIVGVGYRAELKGKNLITEYWLFTSDLFYSS